MSYQSFSFLAFVAVVLFFYYISPAKCQKLVLLLANTIFYVYAGVEYVPFLLSTLVVSYGGSLIMGSFYSKEAEQLKACSTPQEKKAVRQKSKKKSKIILVLSLIIIVALLIVCKYTKFILKNVQNFMPEADFTMVKYIVPLGISFYTFMAIGYMLDVYWKRYKAEKSFISYAAFLTYFPHIVQGPIDRYNRISAQFPSAGNKIKLDPQVLVSGARLVIWGLFKKLVIADRIGIFVNTIYSDYEKYTGIILVVATVVYSIQIYADFSGCIDIVSGVSEMFGIKLAQNFNHPYFSKNIPEFWRRWHISLGDWFTDYIYYPASICKPIKSIKKNCKFKKLGQIIASCFPVMVVWMITGIWHGAAWNYVAWGVYYAVIMVCGIVFADVNSAITTKLKINTESFSWKLWQMARTFTLCTIGRVFFRAPRLMASVAIFANMFKGLGMENVLGDALYSYGLNSADVWLSIVAIAVLWFVDMMQERMEIREKISQQGIIFRWALTIIGILVILVFGIYGPGYNASSFIYEQF